MKLKLLYLLFTVLVSVNMFAQTEFSIPKGFVLVKAGTFTMGSPETEKDRKKDEVLHQVTLSRDYYISEIEVSQGLWEEVVGRNPSYSDGGIGIDYPVNGVSWEEAVDFCNRLSLRDGLNPCYSGSGNDIECDFDADGYRLPTEAEWEYAARGGHMDVEYTVYAGSDNFFEAGWFDRNSGNRLQASAGKAPNSLGIYDMSGNVWEWCWDWYTEYSDALDSPVIDPAGGASASWRVMRGGSWIAEAKSGRIAKRSYDRPGRRATYLGFRLVRTAIIADQ